MTIGIEAERANHPQKTGVEHYAKQLILHLAEIDKINSYILYLRTKPEDWFLNLPKNFKVKVIPFPLFWTQLRLSWEMLFWPVDVLFIPASALPLIHPKKSVVTIHDLAWKFYPQTFTWFNRTYLNWSTGFAVRHCYKVAAISESTKKDLEKFYGVPGHKIAVIHLGYDESFTAKSMATGYALPKRYILFLSTLQPRKNLEGLISAMNLLKEKHPEIPHKLVVVGKPGWKYEKILEFIENNKKHVIYLNFIPDEDRVEILRNSELLALPSFYEGFGMGILEAFAAKVPVAVSNVSSMPEVAGNAAVYFNPEDSKSIAQAILNILSNKSLVEDLKQKGSARLRDFSWKKCARETLKLLSQ